MIIRSRLVLFGSTGLCIVPLLGIQQCEPQDPPPFEPGLSLSEADARILGPTDDQWTGLSVGPAGDFNGDGRPDLLVNSFDPWSGGSTSIFFGPDIAGRLFTSEADINFVGEYPFSDAGTSIAQAGGCDFNGDGIDDLLIGAPYADVIDVSTNPTLSGDNRGKAYLIYGGRDDLAGTEYLALVDDVEFRGEADGDAAGRTVACLGDLNGDGYDDIAVSASYSDRSHPQGGAVYLFYGRSWMSKDVGLDSADAIFVGEAAYDFAGHRVAAAGDVNGDGLEDFLVGAYGNDAGGEEAGKVYLLAGNRTPWSGELSLASSAATFVGSERLRVGWSIASAGDVDGDALDDILIGSFGVHSGADAVGRAFLVYGTTDLTGEHDLGTEAVIFSGETAGDLAGQALSGAGDVNGDDIDDVLFGAGNGAGSQPNAGLSYLMYGSRTRWSGEVALSASPATFLGEVTGDRAGEAVSAVGDVDGDGRGDFLISARGSDEFISEGGCAYLFYGR